MQSDPLIPVHHDLPSRAPEQTVYVGVFSLPIKKTFGFQWSSYNVATNFSNTCFLWLNFKSEEMWIFIENKLERLRYIC